jgi:hypothetical protein
MTAQPRMLALSAPVGLLRRTTRRKSLAIRVAQGPSLVARRASLLSHNHSDFRPLFLLSMCLRPPWTSFYLDTAMASSDLRMGLSAYILGMARRDWLVFLLILIFFTSSNLLPGRRFASVYSHTESYLHIPFVLFTCTAFQKVLFDTATGYLFYFSSFSFIHKIWILISIISGHFSNLILVLVQLVKGPLPAYGLGTGPLSFPTRTIEGWCGFWGIWVFRA